MTEWPLQDAKNKFSVPVNAARTNAPTLADLLLQIPQDDQEFERLTLTARPLNLRGDLEG